MRVAFVLALVVASVSAQWWWYTTTENSEQTTVEAFTAEEITAASESVSGCAPGFGYYRGWCYLTSANDMPYNDAVQFCNSHPGYAPSIHSTANLDFWRNAIHDIVPGSYHFWLDAYCPSNGQNYRWRDGTPTDYYGPRGELRSCANGYGYHMHDDGFEMYDFGTPATAICVYNYDGPTFPPEPEITPEPTDVDAGYCACNPSTTYLDIVFVVDGSADMTTKTVGDATATIKSMLYGLSLGTNMWQSNVGAIAFGDKVQTVANMGTLRNTNDIGRLNFPFLGGKASKMKDAIELASSMISANARSYTRGVIVLLSKSYNQLDSTNIIEAAEEFKSDGGILITIDYLHGMGIKGLQDIATPGYYINEGTADNLPADILYAFCDANCFCADGDYPYDVANDLGREVPKGCYHVGETVAVYDAADNNCQSRNGFVATVHDNEKNFFLLSLFSSRARYWIGLKRYGNYYQWADGSSDTTYWFAPGNPVSGQDCVYAQQNTGFNAPWYSAPCLDPLKNALTYACQFRPCDSEYDCRS